MLFSTLLFQLDNDKDIQPIIQLVSDLGYLNQLLDDYGYFPNTLSEISKLSKYGNISLYGITSHAEYRVFITRIE